MTGTLSIDDLRIDELVATLPDEERLRIAKELVVAAFRICPPPPSDDKLGPDRIALANCTLGAVHCLLHTAVDHACDMWWAAQQEQFAVPGLH